MARLIPIRRRESRPSLGAVFGAAVVIGASVLVAQTPQARSVTEGVYSAAQAARGQQIYQAQCTSCHGTALEGNSGPPLVGDRFASNWSAQPLGNLVDKIQKTMPFNLAGSLSRGQSTDLTAYILQAGKFPAGQTELRDALLAQVVFPTVRSAATPAAVNNSRPSLPPPEGNLAELMRAIAFPNANIIFNVQLKDPGAPRKKLSTSAPFDYVEWGSTIYSGWMAIDLAALALTETAPLLLTPGRQCQNGRPVPVDRPDWQQYVRELVDVGRLSRNAARARNFEAFVDISEKLSDACANCHRVYRDRGGTEGSGATRCQPAPEVK